VYWYQKSVESGHEKSRDELEKLTIEKNKLKYPPINKKELN
jgi:hypothetical protein